LHVVPFTADSFLIVISSPPSLIKLEISFQITDKRLPGASLSERGEKAGDDLPGPAGFTGV